MIYFLIIVCIAAVVFGVWMWRWFDRLLEEDDDEFWEMVKSLDLPDPDPELENKLWM